MAIAPTLDLGASRRGSRRCGRVATTRRSATLIVLIAERLANAADLRAGWSVLDVACGSGNMALAAARLGAVVGVDYVAVAARARRGARRGRAARRGAASRRRRGAAVPRRVLRRRALGHGRDVRARPRAARRRAGARLPAGRDDRARELGAGRLRRRDVLDDRRARPAAGRGCASPMLWGTEAHVASSSATTCRRLAATRGSFTFRYRSPEQFVDFFRDALRADAKAFAALDGDGRGRLRRTWSARAPLRPARAGTARGDPGRLPRGRRHPGRLGRHLHPGSRRTPVASTPGTPAPRKTGPVAMPREGYAPVGELLRHTEELHPLVGDLHGRGTSAAAIPAPRGPAPVPLSSERKTMLRSTPRDRTSPSQCLRRGERLGHHRDAGEGHARSGSARDGAGLRRQT